MNLQNRIDNYNWLLSKEEIATLLEKIISKIAYKRQSCCELKFNTDHVDHVIISFSYNNIVQDKLKLYNKNILEQNNNRFTSIVQLLHSIYPFDNEDSMNYVWSWDNMIQSGNIMENPIRIYNYLVRINEYDFKTLYSRMKTYIENTNTKETHAFVFCGNSDFGNFKLKTFDTYGIDLFRVGNVDENDKTWYIDYIQEHVLPFDNYEHQEIKMRLNNNCLHNY